MIDLRLARPAPTTRIGTPSRAARAVRGALLLAAALALPTGAWAAQTAPARDSGTFVLKRDGQTVVTERYRRTPDSLHVELTAADGTRAVLAARLTPAGLVAQLTAREYGAGTGSSPGAAPTRSATLTFHHDSAALFVTAARGTDTTLVATWANAVPFVRGSGAFLEQIVRRARLTGGQEVAVPVFIPGGGGQTMNATVTFAPGNRVQLTMATVMVELRLDASGRLRSASAPAQRLTLERIGG